MKTTLYLLLIIYASTIISCTKSDDPYDFVWPVSTPSAEGLNEQMLDSACWKADELGFVDALLVIKNGNLVAEEYYNGFNENMAHQIYSDTKSFMSVLIGIAFDNGLIKNLDKKIMEFSPEYAYPGMDSRFYDITIRHLLTMRMGIDNEEKNGVL